MLTDNMKKELQDVAKKICEKNDLQRVCFLRNLGKRRHFLAGHGKEAFGQTSHINITKEIALSWEGVLSEKVLISLVNKLKPLAGKILIVSE